MLQVLMTSTIRHPQQKKTGTFIKKQAPETRPKLLKRKKIAKIKKNEVHSENSYVSQTAHFGSKKHAEKLQKHTLNPGDDSGSATAVELAEFLAKNSASYH